MTEPKRQYRPNIQAGAQLADAAPVIAKQEPRIPADLLALGLAAFGAVVFDISYLTDEPISRLLFWLGREGQAGQQHIGIENDTQGGRHAQPAARCLSSPRSAATAASISAIPSSSGTPS